MTDAQVCKMVRDLRIALGVDSSDDLVKEMVNRFLCWKLPKDFAPDAGISFKPSKPYEGDEYANCWWPIGTNLLNAEQAEELVRWLLGPMLSMDSAAKAKDPVLIEYQQQNGGA